MGDAFGQVFFTALNACGRIIRPARILAGITYAGGDFRVFLHPALPVGVEIAAEFGGFVGRGEGEERSQEREEGEEDCDSHFFVASGENYSRRDGCEMVSER